jgi:hypothetical protein
MQESSVGLLCIVLILDSDFVLIQEKDEKAKDEIQKLVKSHAQAMVRI